MSPDFNFEPLSPVSFLKRAGRVHADKIAVIDDGKETTYRDLLIRSEKLAGALQGLGVAAGDRVAVLMPNTQPMLEAHYGVPMAGAVLVTLNTRLSSAELAYIIEHSGARSCSTITSSKRSSASSGGGWATCRCARCAPAPAWMTNTEACSQRRRATAARSPTSAGCSRSTTPAAPPGGRRG